jgi:membrane protein DedA with SNARE-associated domain
MSDASPIFQWLNNHPNFAGLVTFLISAGESVAIIGTIIPGSVMMTAIGALAGAGVIPLWSTIFWAIIGAIVGDGISYWIGFYFKDQLHYVWPFKQYPYLLGNGESFFRNHGGMSVFIGRFVGPVRALVPLVAGMLGVKPIRFAVANIASAIGWAPAYMLP